MELEILVPDGVIVQTRVNSLSAADASGRFGLWPHHQKFLTLLAPCVISFNEEDGNERYAAADGGVLLLIKDRISIVTREAVVAEQLDEVADAAESMLEARRALAQAHRYQELVMQSLAALPSAAKSLPLPQSDGGRVMLMVLTSEQPFCGGFNQQVLTLAEKRWREYRAAGQIHLLAVGQRGVAQMMARGIIPDESVQATASMQGLRNLVRRLVKLVDERYVTGEMAELRVIYNRYQSVSEQVPTEEKLLPFDWSRVAESAIPDGGELDRYLELPELLAGLIGEYVFINLYRIAAESFTSEQANRLLAMDGATRNTEKMIQSLAELERRQRQELITRQVLELIAARFAAD